MVLTYRIHTILLVVSLFCFSGALIPLIISGGEYTNTDNLIVLKIIRYLPVFLFLFITLVYKKVQLSNIKLYVIFIIITVVSTLFSKSIIENIIYLSILFLNIMIADVIISKLGSRDVYNVLYKFSSFFIILSLLIVLFVPSLGVMDGFHDGAWRGVFTHKNGLGAFSGLMIIICVLKTDYTSKVILLLSILLLIMSGSLTALIATFITLYIYILFKVFSGKNFSYKVAVILLTLTLFSGLYIVFNDPDRILNLIGKSPTLTGRLELWLNLYEAILNRPYIGYGYFSFWNDSLLQSKYLSSMVWETGKAHNMYIDLSLHFGLVGVLFFLFAIIQTVRLLLIYMNYYEKKYLIFMILYITYFVILGFAEMSFMHNDMYSILLIIIVMLVLNGKKNSLNWSNPSAILWTGTNDPTNNRR